LWHGLTRGGGIKADLRSQVLLSSPYFHVVFNKTAIYRYAWVEEEVCS
jgi:hypothetical protein